MLRGFFGIGSTFMKESKNQIVDGLDRLAEEFTLAPLLVSRACHDKTPQTGRLQRQTFLTGLEAKSA